MRAKISEKQLQKQIEEDKRNKWFLWGYFVIAVIVFSLTGNFSFEALVLLGIGILIVK